MRRILVMTSGSRADEAPLQPVMAALRAAGCKVRMARVMRSRQKCRQVDVVLVLGDRFEIGHGALQATVAGKPIAHIHGGEASFGSFDNQIRDAITKLAHIHFVAAGPMRARLLALGERSNRIHVVGAPALDSLPPVIAEPRQVRKTFVVTYHLPTLGPLSARGAEEVIRALKEFPDYRVVWTGVNKDPGAQPIADLFEASGYENVRLSYGAYLREVRHAMAVVGNSSSGIIEAPSLGCPTVNVGPRQDGRLKGPSVLDCPEERTAIVMALHRAITYSGMFTNPYGGPGASAKIAGILATARLDRVKRW